MNRRDRDSANNADAPAQHSISGSQAMNLKRFGIRPRRVTNDLGFRVRVLSLISRRERHELKRMRKGDREQKRVRNQVKKTSRVPEFILESGLI